MWNVSRQDGPAQVKVLLVYRAADGEASESCFSSVWVFCCAGDFEVSVLMCVCMSAQSQGLSLAPAEAGSPLLHTTRYTTTQPHRYGGAAFWTVLSWIVKN